MCFGWRVEFGVVGVVGGLVVGVKRVVFINGDNFGLSDAEAG